MTAVLAIVLLGLIATEWLLVPHEHPRFPWHHVPGYAAMIGLLASVLLVQLARLLGSAFLQRRAGDDD